MHKKTASSISSLPYWVSGKLLEFLQALPTLDGVNPTTHTTNDTCQWWKRVKNTYETVALSLPPSLRLAHIHLRSCQDTHTHRTVSS